MAFKFEKLRVWQKALELSSLVHNVTREFPKEEMFILTSQIKRGYFSYKDEKLLPSDEL